MTKNDKINLNGKLLISIQKVLKDSQVEDTDKIKKVIAKSVKKIAKNVRVKKNLLAKKTSRAKKSL